MSLDELSGSVSMDHVLEKLKMLEDRVVSLEKTFSTTPAAAMASEPVAAVEKNQDDEEMIEMNLQPMLESKVGEMGLMWLGNVVLLFGISFLMQYVHNLGNHWMPALIGYVCAGAMFLLSFRMKGAFSHISGVLELSVLFLFYYTTLRLHYFSAEPLIVSPELSIVLLLAALGVIIYSALKTGKQSRFAIALLLTVLTAMVSDRLHIYQIILVFASLGSLYLLYTYRWWKMVYLTQVLVYISLILWFWGNPAMGHAFQLPTAHYYTHLYLFLVGGIFSMVVLIPDKEETNSSHVVKAIILNGVFFVLALAMYIITFFKTGYNPIFLTVTLFCLLFSIYLQYQKRGEFAPAFYALYSFLALSATVYGRFGLPQSYFYLALQSLLVLSMALWFRSRLIVVMNLALYVVLLYAYILSGNHFHAANFAFALVGLISARVINIKRERLVIKTEYVRNTYLIFAFFMLLYALYSSVPKQFITLSWSLAGVAYFVLSFVMKNPKYRLMAIFTLIATAVYLFVVDLAKIALIYRVGALLFLAAISLVVSVYYTKRRKKADLENAES